MSIKEAKAVIQAFLKRKEPEVLSINGNWGVGKTYLWKKIIKFENKKNNSFENYAYVSLFGITSLEDFKLSILANTVDKSLAEENFSLLGIAKEPINTEKLTKAGSSYLYKIISRNSEIFGRFGNAIQSVAFNYLENTLICIDDFERKSSSLEPKNILGLVSFLKEERNCKVALIFNDNAFENEEDINTYKTLKEKVVDSEVSFSPTSSEINNIVFKGKSIINESLKTHTKTLKITNIRILKRIKKSAKEVFDLLNNTVEKEVMEQALKTVTLFCWCYHIKDDDVPDYDYLKNFSFGYLGLGGKKDKRSEKEIYWDSIIRNYGHTNSDEFDLALGKAIETGSLDKDLLKEKASFLNEKILSQQGEDSFRAAWDLFYDSFKDNENELVNKLEGSFKSNVQYLSSQDLDATVGLLKKLGKSEVASQLIEIFIDKYKDKKGIFDLKNYIYPLKIKDEEVQKKFNQKFNKMKEIKGAKDVLEEISEINGWSASDIEVLGNTSKEEFYSIFKDQEGKKLNNCIKKCLEFGRLQTSDEGQAIFKKIAETATNALKKFGNETPLNKIRVERFGINVDDE